MRVDRMFSSTSLGGTGPGVYDTHSSATGLPEMARRLRQKGDARFRAMAAGEDMVADARSRAAVADSAFDQSILGVIGVGTKFIEAGREVTRALRENEASARRKIDLVEAETGFDANVRDIPGLMAATGVSGENAQVTALRQARDHALGRIRDEDDRAQLAPRLDRKLAAAVGEATKVSHQRTMRDTGAVIDKAINALGAKASAPGEVSEHFNNIQEIYGLIDDGRRAGVFGAPEAGRRQAAARTTYANQFGRAAMARDPQAFLAGLDEGRFDALLGKEEGARARWRDEGARVLDRQESAAKLEDLSGYAADYGQVRAQVDSGALSLAGLEEMDWLRKSDIDWLTKRIEEKDAEARRQQELLADMDLMRDGKGPARDSENGQRALEAWFALYTREAFEKPTDATPQIIADTARRFDGNVPDFVTDQIVETFASGQPEFQVLAAKAMIELGVVGEGVTSRLAPPDAARAYVMANAAKAGMSSADAVAHTAQALAPDAATKAARQAALDAGDYDKANRRWFAQQGAGDGVIARRNAARAGRDGATAPLEAAALQDSFKTHFARAFMMTGDAGAARTLAANLAADEALEALRDGGMVAGGDEDATVTGGLVGDVLAAGKGALDSYAKGMEAQADAGASVVRGIAGGVRDAVQNGIVTPINELATFLEETLPLGGIVIDENGVRVLSAEELRARGGADDLVVPDFAGEPRNAGEAAVRKTSQFLAGFLPALKAVRAVSGGAKLGSAGLVAEGAAADIVTNLTVFDGQEENLFDLWHDLGLPRNVLSDYLTAKGGSEVEDRMKNALAGALEGAVGGAAFPVLVDSVVRSARALRGVRDGWRVRTGSKGLTEPPPSITTDGLLSEDFRTSKFFDEIGGYRFVRLQGSSDLGRATLDSSGVEAPIRLRRATLKHVDDPPHRQHAASANYRDGLHLTVDVAKNWTHRAKSPRGAATYLLAKRNGDDKIIVVEVRKAANAEYYDITTSGLRRRDEFDSLEIIEVRTPTPDPRTGDLDSF